MPTFFTDLTDYLAFVFERLDWLSVVDILLVTVIFFIILLLLRDTQAVVLLRGGLLLLALLAILTNQEVFPAFSWLVSNTLPALLVAIPVIFAPEIRRGLERIGRTSSIFSSGRHRSNAEEIVKILMTSTSRLSTRKHGALIVLQRYDNLQEYINTGVMMDAQVTPELLLQIFYPNTPLHDGAVVLSGLRVVAASCVLPLSASGSLLRTPERQMGLRHRAALGISEVGDAVALVVSEETGAISIANSGRMIHNLNLERLENTLLAFYRPFEPRGFFASFRKRDAAKPPKKEER